MLISIHRSYKEKATTGMVFVDGNYFCHSLELPKGKCIPEGEYQLHLTYSPKFNRIMPLVVSVPHFEGIRIHPGNFIKHTRGCPLLAYDVGVDPNGDPAIFRSRICFEELMRWLTEANKNQTLALEILEGPSDQVND